MGPLHWNSITASSSSKSRAKPLGADQRLLILQKLQGKLDLSILFEIFAREIEKQIDITRLAWEFEGTSTQVRDGDTSEYRQTFLLRFNNNELGKLQYHTPYELDQDEISLLHTYHRLFAGPLTNGIEFRKVKNMALQDCLSGLGNRSCFEQDLNHAIAVSERRSVGLVLMMFDLDNFKQVNDRYGHPDGDRVIRQFGHLLKQTIRASDRSYRIGGDEFAALLQPATSDSAIQVFSRILQLTQQDAILQTLKIGCSCGFAEYQKGDTANALLERADRQLYQHKRAR